MLDVLISQGTIFTVLCTAVRREAAFRRAKHRQTLCSLACAVPRMAPHCFAGRGRCAVKNGVFRAISARFNGKTPP